MRRDGKRGHSHPDGQGGGDPVRGAGGALARRGARRVRRHDGGQDAVPLALRQGDLWQARGAPQNREGHIGARWEETERIRGLGWGGEVHLFSVRQVARHYRQQVWIHKDQQRQGPVRKHVSFSIVKVNSIYFINIA